MFRTLYVPIKIIMLFMLNVLIQIHKTKLLLETIEIYVS